jgi:DNA-binding beta-propeller fold protein YncE
MSDGQPSLGCFDSADTKLYHVGSGTNVGIIDTRSDSVRGYVTMPDDVYGLAYAPAVDRVYAGGGYYDGFIAAIDGKGDSLITSLPIPGGGGVYGICLDPTRSTVYGFGNQRAVFTVVDCRADTIVGQFAGGDCCGGSLYNPISDKVYTVDYVDGVMLVIDAATHSILATLGIVDGAGDSLTAKLTFSYYHRYLAYDPAHNVMYFDHDSVGMNAIALLDGATDSVIGNILFPGEASDMTAVPQADRMFVSDIYNSCVYVIRMSPPAVAETPLAGVRRVAHGATIIRGVLFLPGASSPKPQAPSLMDATGRKVLDLHSGVNDVSRLAPGVYFVREEPHASSRKPQAVRKIVVTR